MNDPTTRRSSFFDTAGCLNENGVQALARAPAGRGPAELALHVAACPRCQDRLLAGQREARPRASPPPAWRIVLMAGLTVFLMLMLLITVHFLR